MKFGIIQAGDSYHVTGPEENEDAIVEKITSALTSSEPLWDHRNSKGVRPMEAWIVEVISKVELKPSVSKVR